MSHKKIQISINSELLKKIDLMADSMHMSRSGFISFATNYCIQQPKINLIIPPPPPIF
jgi:metal-responsive CopG/Arc/MetJ family transcriptional regulator